MNHLLLYKQNHLWYQFWKSFSVVFETIFKFFNNNFCWWYSELWIWRLLIRPYIHILFWRSTHFYKLRSRSFQLSSSSCTTSTSLLICAKLSHHARFQSSASENLTIFFSDNRVPLRLSFSFENFFNVHSYSRFNPPVGDQESVSSLSVINNAELPYHSLYRNTRPPTADPYFYTLLLDKQILNHPRQDLRYHIRPVNKSTTSLRKSAFIRSPELTRLTHTSIELKFEITVKFFELNAHPIPTSSQVKHRTLPSLFVVTSSQFTSTDEPPFDHHWRSITFHNPISGIKHKTTFWNPWFSSL